jgi:hypothetical protein
LYLSSAFITGTEILQHRNSCFSVRFLCLPYAKPTGVYNGMSAARRSENKFSIVISIFAGNHLQTIS